MGLEKVETLSTILIKAGAKRVLKDLVSNFTLTSFCYVEPYKVYLIRYSRFVSFESSIRNEFISPFGGLVVSMLASGT
jgi:hypothetical protein